jgi:hypothetical protein
MDEVTAPHDHQKADRVRPRCGGGNLGNSPSEETQEGPGGGPSCVWHRGTHGSPVGPLLRLGDCLWRSGGTLSRLRARDVSRPTWVRGDWIGRSAVGALRASMTDLVRLPARPLRVSCRPALLAHLYWFVEAGLPAPHRERLRERPFEASATCFSARCQTRPGASSGGCVERVRKESQCPPKHRR